MMRHPHMETALCRHGASLDDARLVVLLLHGRGQSPAVVFESIAERLDLSGVAYMAPTAAGNSWYPQGFMAPLEANQPDLDAALARVGQLSSELAARGFAPGAQAILGFSQGACLGAEFVWRSQQRFAALIAFTGGLIGPAGMVWPQRDRRFPAMPVFLPNSDTDLWVPLVRSQETAAVFRAHGAEVTERIFPARAHQICDQEIDSARAMLQRVLDAQRARPEVVP